VSTLFVLMTLRFVSFQSIVDSQERAFQQEHRERNNQLVPLLLERLRTWIREDKEEREKAREAFKRPFAALAVTANDVTPAKRRRTTLSTETADGCVSPSRHSEASNSSWAEVEPQIIGHLPVFPLTRRAKMVFALRMLTPLGEYQEVRKTYGAAAAKRKLGLHVGRGQRVLHT